MYYRQNGRTFVCPFYFSKDTLMILFEQLKYNVILASNSPRRRELMQSLGLAFDIAPAIDIDESFPDGLEPSNIPLYIAKKKAEAHIADMSDDTLLITADTVVLAGEDYSQVLGKPRDDDEALAMLKKLSGTKHKVVTGVTLNTTGCQIAFSDSAIVEFMPLPTNELREYVKRYQPLDKAGAYGIQEWVGLAGIRSIEGSFYTVMGLPTHLLYENLRKFCK